MELSKHWFQWLLWGRLGFDPDITNDRFIDILAHRYPEISAPELLKAWQHASMIYPITTGFHWGEFDFQWYIEACKSRPGPAQTTSGFHDVNRFITLPPHESTDYMSIPDFVRTTMENKTIQGTTPWEVAELLHDHADNALEIVGQFENLRQEELNRTINDIKAMANLGKYYAFKIQGATALALFRKTGNLTSQQEAVRALESASDVWKQYIGIARQQYINPFWTNRVGHIDWGQLTLEVEKDIAIASAPL